MARFNYITQYMEANEDAKKLVTLIEDYAKNDIANRFKVESAYDTKYSMPEKAKFINDLFVSEVARRSKFSVNDFDGSIVEYANFDVVAKMQAFVTKIMVDTITPIYLNATGLAMLAEFHPVDFGGVAEFEVKDPSLYKVSKIGRRQKHTKVQEKKKVNKTIAMDSYGLTTFSTLPQIMVGEAMIADDAIKMALSINKKIYTLVVKEFIAKAEAVTDSKYVLTSFSENEFLEKLRNGSAYNGSKMVIVGDAVALKSILPASENVRILLTDEYNTSIGYMDMFNTYSVMGFDVVRDDDETDGTLGLPTNRIYGIPNDGNKLIHVAVGMTTTNTDEAYDNDNLSILSTLRKDIGVKLATTGKIVRCNLA